MSADFSLIVCLPGEAPVQHPLEGDTITFGRSPENSIQMLVAEVSVRHGSLIRGGEGFRIVDPGSTNGTILNGAKVGPEGADLKPMDRLRIGTVVSAFFVPSAVLAATPLPELVASLEAAAPAARPQTAPIAVAQPGPAQPAPVRAAVPVSAPAGPAQPGGATVRLDQVRGPAAPGVRPAPVGAPGAPAAPARPAPVAPGAAPAPLKPPGVAPVAPGAAPVRPAPVAPPGAAPLRPPGVAPVAAPGAAAPVTPQPVPLKRPGPAAPSVPLPKLPPKPGS